MMLGSRRKSEPEPQAQYFDDPAVDMGLADFLLENADPRESYTARVFRIYRRPGQRETTAFLQTWKDSTPEYEEIASQYGPGEYKINLIYTPPGGKRTATSRTIAIDPNWEGAALQQTGSAPAMAGPAIDPFMAARESRREMMELFTLVLKAMGDSNKGNGQSSGAGLLEELQATLGKTMIANYETNSRLINDLNRQRLDLPPDDDDDDEDQPFVMQAAQWLLGAWKKYGSSILAAPRQAGSMLKPQTQGNAHIQYALSHPEEYQTLYSTFQSQTGADPGKIDEFIHALGYPTPAELTTEINQQPPQDPAGPTPQ
jgi:hypothetical protein